MFAVFDVHSLHLKGYVGDKHSLSFKTFALHCSQNAISFIQNVCNVCDTLSYYIAVGTCIFKINTKKIET